MTRSEIIELTGEDPIDMYGEAGMEDYEIENDIDEDVESLIHNYNMNIDY